MKKANRKKKRGSGRGSIAIIVVLLLVIMSVQTYKLYQKNQTYLAKEEELEAQLDAENDRQQELEEYENSLDSDEYTEKEAHSKLGMLYDNETVYKEQDD